MGKTVTFEYSLGDRVRDKLTGFEGVVLSRTDYMTGCFHYGVQPEMLTAEGKQPDWEWIDGTYLEIVDDEYANDAVAGTSGGPSSNILQTR